MKVIIVEDEVLASENLIYLLKNIDPNIEVLKVLDSVKSSINFFSKPIEADLIFMDIHLADGLSFEIFDKVTVKTPLIFTTAYDQYAIKAFKVNSVDYLLKPLNEEELADAIIKFNSIVKTEPTINNSQIESVLQLLNSNNKTFKSTYLVQSRDELIPLKISDIAYFYIEVGIIKAITLDNKSFIINEKLESIVEEIDTSKFYRVNRQFVVNREAVLKIKFYFNGKLVLKTNPPFKERIIVSKAKATEFKNWMNN
ncbi:two component transcriptional regulator, LytTR family [Lutibacter oricola]|uniref:Two component transcriptional regulator, LytTR family n=1 Tax=Lutibacter oricola TaxID=762486 RepID=A0A1H3BM13_9FLAO|nr:LytTR family DNA-binding domain-containing protein [Lutibacter oricola]SDX43032.1 two component transcriptional regulator, LytTR family [Lutibacter oricola]